MGLPPIRSSSPLCRLANLGEFVGEQYRWSHGLLSDPRILEGQHPIRAWEYSQALRALERLGVNFQEHRYSAFLDVGGAGSRFWEALTAYTDEYIDRVDPQYTSLEIEDGPHGRVRNLPGDLHTYVTDHPELQYDAVFCLSVLEHMRAPRPALIDLARLVRPDGLLILTVDAAAEDIDQYHFHWMRQWIGGPASLAMLLKVAEGCGLTPLDPVDLTYRGPTVYDYTVASLCWRKQVR